MKAREFVIYIILFAAGLGFVNTCNHKEKATKAIIQTEENIRERSDSLTAIDKRYKEKLSEREKESEILFEKLIKTESLLQQEKAKVVSMQQKIKLIVKSDWQGISTDEKLGKCDSLREIVSIYEEERAITDSLTEAKIQNMHEMINLKDQQLMECDLFYESMKETLEESISDTKTASDELKKVNKQLKRKQFFNKLLAAGGAVITIVASVLLLKNGK